MEQELRRTYMVIIEPDDDGVFIATAPSFPGVVEQGETQEEALENMREALDFTIDCMLDDEEHIPNSDWGEGRIVRDVEFAV